MSYGYDNLNRVTNADYTYTGSVETEGRSRDELVDVGSPCWSNARMEQARARQISLKPFPVWLPEEDGQAAAGQKGGEK